jgi:outer membrane protein assembly factor BamA
MKSILIIAGLLFAVSIASAQEGYMVHSISFSGNNSFPENDLRNIMLTKESPASFYRFIYRIFSIGRAPQYFDPIVLKTDVQRIKEFYKHNGFFLTSVDTSVSYNMGANEVDIGIQIEEGPGSYVSSVLYHGIIDSSKNFLESMNEKPILGNRIRYSVDKLNGEITRVLGILQNDGYPYARRDSTPVVSVDGPMRSDSDSAHVIVDLYFSNGRKYYWGDISIQPLDSDDVSSENRIVSRELLFKHGEAFNLSKKTESEKQIDALNLFVPVRIALPSTPPVSDTLPGTLSIKLRPAHDVTLGPLVSDENNAFNFGGELGYLHRNFLGDARLLTFTTSLQLESVGLLTFGSKALSDTVTVGRIDASAQLTQPYFFSNATSLTEAVSFLVDKQRPYVQLVLRNKIRVSERLAESTTGYLDWDIERARFDSLQAIPMPQGLETPQFNSILSFTLQRDKTDAVYNPTKGFFNQITIEEGGILPNLIHLIFKNSDFPYARYWKFTLLEKWFLSMNDNATNIFAFKSKVGYAQEYGTYEQDSVGPIPLNYRFFAGGSGSVRGWRTRELGDIPQPEYGGKTLLELNFEDRFQIIGDFGGVLFVDAGNLWNTYRDVTINSIAGAIGFGFRYNTIFGPLRVDFGNRFYDPTAPSGQQFIFQLFGTKQDRTKLLSQLVIHFGIMQAF